MLVHIKKKTLILLLSFIRHARKWQEQGRSETKRPRFCLRLLLRKKEEWGRSHCSPSSLYLSAVVTHRCLNIEQSWCLLIDIYAITIWEVGSGRVWQRAVQNWFIGTLAFRVVPVSAQHEQKKTVYRSLDSILRGWGCSMNNSWFFSGDGVECRKAPVE